MHCCTVGPHKYRSTSMCVRLLKNMPADDESMCFIANSPPESVLNPNRDLFSPPSVCSHRLFPLLHSFVYFSLMPFIHSHAPSFISSLTAVSRNETLKSLSRSYWLMEGITSKDGSSLIVYDERPVRFNVCFRWEILARKCQSWINSLL